MSTVGINGAAAPRRMDVLQPTESVVPPTQPEPVAPFTLGRTDPMRALLLRPAGGQEGNVLATLLHRPAAIRKMYGSLNGRGGDSDIQDESAALAAHIEQGGSLESFAATHQLDAAQIYLLGLFARSGVQRRNDPRLTKQLDDFADAHGAALNAAANTAAALGAFGQTQTDLAWMRALYQSATTESGTLQDIFESMLARFGIGRFEDGARAMLRAFSDDLASPHASRGLDRLQLVIMNGMFAVRNILGVIHSGNAFMRRHRVNAELPGDEPATPSQPTSPGTALQQNGDGRGDAKENADSPTAHLVKLLLQLCVSSAAVKLVPSFLGTQVGAQDDAAMHTRRIHSEFIRLVDSLPVSLWKQRAHKDQLIRALRQQASSDLSDD